MSDFFVLSQWLPPLIAGWPLGTSGGEAVLCCAVAVAERVVVTTRIRLSTH